MRNVLVSHARARAAGKRGAGAGPVPLDEALDRLASEGLDVAAIHDAVEFLAVRYDRPGQVITCDFSWG